MKKPAHSLSLTLFVSLFLSSALPPVPAFALRIEESKEGKARDLLRAGMEERGPFAFHPFHPESAADLLGSAVGIRRLSLHERLLVPEPSPLRVNPLISPGSYISNDGRALFFGMGDGLTIQMNHLGDDGRLLIQEGSEFLKDRKRQRRLTLSVREGDQPPRSLFDWPDPDSETALIRQIVYLEAPRGPELILYLDRRVTRIVPGARWEDLFSASPLIRAGPGKPETVRISLRSEEELVPPSILWAGDLTPLIQVIAGQPRPPEVSLDLWAPTLTESELLDSLELQLVIENETEPLPVKTGVRVDPKSHKPGRENFRVWVQLPEPMRDLLAQRGYLRYRFQYRLKGDLRWGDTAHVPAAHNGEGEIICHPDWLFRAGLYKINLKAWHSEELPAFEAARRMLPQLKKLGVQAVLLHGIHPGTVFEIDDYEKADPQMGGDVALDRLLQEGRKMGIRFLIPWVPGHASAKNRLIQEDPGLFYELAAPEEFPQPKTTTVPIKGKPVTFLRGNVFRNGTVHSAEIPEGFGGNTVQFNLWNPAVREKMGNYWETVLGEWARRGISGFYGDTAHSIDGIAPGWLDQIEKRVRARNPGIVFGYEALWGKDGHFVGSGASFAQAKWLYLDLLDVVYGRKRLSDFAKTLENNPLEMLQRETIYLQHYDGDVNPVALHVEWSHATDPGGEWRLNGVLAVLQMLGMPGGVPMIEEGQESGHTEKWEVNGRTYNDNKKWNYGQHPETPQREPFTLFKDQSSPAQHLRELYSHLFRLRAANPASWGPERARYPAASSDVFASYRSAGDWRLLVILQMNRSMQDQSARIPIVVELDKLGLSGEEMEGIRQAIKKPSLVWPSPDVKSLRATLEQGLLKLDMPPLGAIALGFKLRPAAGAEEAVFPVPVLTDRPAAWEVWQDGGNVYPSSRSPLGTVAFVSPKDGKAGLGIYASLWKLDQLVPQVFKLPGIPPGGPVYLRGEWGVVPHGTFQRVKEILEEKGLEVVARISTKESSWEVPMEPIDAGGGLIRFEGSVPVRQQFVGDYTVAVEVHWNRQWYRLNETGWFRIHGADSNGSKLRIPEAKKYKLWVSPTGQPVVIGWTPDQRLEPSAQQRIPIADQAYWIRLSGGRFYLLSRDQMERFGFPYHPDQPDVRPGERIVEAAMDVDPLGGIVAIPSSQVFEDQDGTLSARLRKSFQVLGIRWHREKLKPPPSLEADGQVRDMVRRLELVQDGASLRDFLAQLEEIGWGQVVETLNSVVPEERDRFLRLMHRTFDRLAEEKPSAPVVRINKQHPPRSFQMKGPPVLALSFNGVQDLTLRLREDQPGRLIEGNLFEGGGPLAVARAVANMRVGGEVNVVALGFGDSGERLFEGLRQKGFHEAEGTDLEFRPAQKEGVETRVSVNGSVSSSPTVSVEHVQQAVKIAVEKITAHGPGGTLVIGEHLVGVDDTENPYRVAEILAAVARRAKELGWQTVVAASSSWDAKTFEKILETQPDTFHLDLEPFARLVDSTEEDLLYRPKEEVAELADQIRRRYGIGRFIVSLKAAGEILVTDSGWFSAIPSPVLELTYVTGERDVVLGVFTSLLQMGAPPAQALDQAVVAGVLHMEGWGRPVTEKQIQANLHRAGVYELLRPKELLAAPAVETEQRGTGLTAGIAAVESIPPAVLAPRQGWKNLQQRTVWPADGVPSNPNRIREIFKQLRPAEGPSRDLLIGPGALAGSDQVPALWPLLMELKNVLPEQQWEDIQRRLTVYAENETLLKLLKEAGYEAPPDLDSLKQRLQQRVSGGGGLVFYMGRRDSLLRDQIRGVTQSMQSIQLTPKNYLNMLGHLLELLGYRRPEPQQLEGLPEALAEAA